jgi:hypothetical protein
MAIVVAGAAGEHRLDDILDTIEQIQTAYLPWMDKCIPFNVSSATPQSLSLEIQNLAANTVPRIAPPLLSDFLDRLSHPFILSGFLNNWPALQEHPWSSPEYLMRVAGRGRIVPVEIGSDYRTADWNQTMLPWEEFLQRIGISSETMDGNPSENRNHNILYLAQHSLLTQFPALRSDIIIPDYVYSAPAAPPFFPNYRPPGNDEQMVINAWLGPKGTISPAHTVVTLILNRRLLWPDRLIYFPGSLFQLLWYDDTVKWKPYSYHAMQAKSLAVRPFGLPPLIFSTKCTPSPILLLLTQRGKPRRRTMPPRKLMRWLCSATRPGSMYFRQVRVIFQHLNLSCGRLRFVQ